MFSTEIPEIRQFQIVQHAIDDIEIKLVSTRRLSAEEEARVAGWLHQRCGHAFPVRITYHAEIPRGPSGKFLDFRSAKIGRASCRERVCQDVEYSGVAVSSKKTNHKTDLQTPN